MAQDKSKINKAPNTPQRPSGPIQNGWTRDKQINSNNDVSNTLRPKTGNPPIGKEPGKK